MIPKVIHYCWFGGNPLPELALKCIESWKKYCPDYEIIEWNEKNFDININKYCKQAYECGKWAFVSDVARLYALVNIGGIYMDTDVEVIKPIDDFLCCEAFSGFESEIYIPTGIMAAEKGQPFFEELLSSYNNISFVDENGNMDLTTNVVKITEASEKYGFVPNNQKQTVAGLVLYPKDYFCPKNNKTGVIEITDNTHTIHHFSGSWHTEDRVYFSELQKNFYRAFKIKISSIIIDVICEIVTTIKFFGFKKLVDKGVEFVKRGFKFKE